jgi:magnesium transporter
MTDPEINELIIQALEDGDLERARSQLKALHPSEIADVLESLPGKERESIWDLLEPGSEGDVLSHAQDAVRAGLLENMEPEQVAEATQDLESDDAADILQDLPEDIADTVLQSMDSQNRERLASILSYEEDTAGGLMNIDVVPVRADVSLEVVARYLKKLGALPDQTDMLMVVDRSNGYLGVLRLSDILTQKPELQVSDVMIKDDGILASTPDDDVARLFEQRDLISAAVIDQNNILLGRITVDDVVDVIQENAEEAVLNMAGLGEDDMFAPVFSSTRRRAIWLGINLFTAFLASWVIGRYEDTIQQLVALAVLMPIVASMGGIAGCQTLTLSVRGLAMGHISKKNSRALLRKEVSVGLLNGFIFAVIVAVLASLWFDNISLGIIIGAAMLINLIIAAFVGVFIPVTLNRLGIDPAIAGGVLLTTVTDVIGFVTFLGLATLFLVN